MSAENNEAAIDAAVNEKLAAMIRSYQQPAAGPQGMQVAPQQQQPQAMGGQGFGLPAQQQMGMPMGGMGMGGMGMPGQQMGMPMGGMGGAGPQPTGVAVPVKVPLPDGREMTIRVEFGPEWAGRLQELGAFALQMFGPFLSAWYPKGGGSNGGGSWGGGGGGGWNNGGNRGGYGGRGRW